MTLALAGKIAWVLMVTGWYVIRFPFERRAKRAQVAVTDRGLAETIRMTISFTGLGVLPALGVFASWPQVSRYEPHLLQILAGIALACLALVLFRRTHKALGKMWSVSLDLREKHKLVTTGIYERVRHPMYSAFWTMALAQALLVPNLIAGLAGLVGFGTLYFLRVGPEERMMEAAFGEEYRLYKARTARIIPGVY